MKLILKADCKLEKEEKKSCKKIWRHKEVYTKVCNDCENYPLILAAKLTIVIFDMVLKCELK